MKLKNEMKLKLSKNTKNTQKTLKKYQKPSKNTQKTLKKTQKLVKKTLKKHKKAKFLTTDPGSTSKINYQRKAKHDCFQVFFLYCTI
jgi:hypothetical protein